MVVRRPSSSIQLLLLLASVALIVAALASPLCADSTDGEIAAKDPAAHVADSSFDTDTVERRIIKRPAESPTTKTAENTTPTPLVTSTPNLWRPIAALVAVLLVIAAAAWLFRRFAGGSRQFRLPAGIDIIARTMLNPKQSLCLVKLGSRLVLLGVSPNHIASLQTVDQPDEVAQLLGLLESQSPGSISSAFGKLFHQHSGKYDQSTDLWPDGDEETDNDPNDQMNNAKGEIANLLKKVKGLTRLGVRP